MKIRNMLAAAIVALAPLGALAGPHAPAPVAAPAAVQAAPASVPVFTAARVARITYLAMLMNSGVDPVMRVFI